MTVQRISAGVPTGGQFATSARTEASLTLAPEPVAVPRHEGVVISAVLDETDNLISRATADGSFTATLRQEDVEVAVRECVPHLDEDTFDRHMSAIAQAAEVVSIVERADETDVEVYEDYAAEVGIDIEDFPAGPDWEPGDGYHDLPAYRGAVISAWDEKVLAATTAMVEADLDASRGA